MTADGPGREPEPAPAPEPAPEPEPAPAPEPEALTSLFGDGSFHDYDAGAAPAGARTPRGSRRAAPSGRISRAQRVLIAVLGALAAVLALVALFFLGTKLPVLLGAAPAVATSSPSASRSPSPSPTPTVAAVGPVAPGIHGWNQLLGGECLNPYTTPWVERFTVVDCAVPHPAQLVFRGTFPGVTPVFPGVAALQAQISLLCGAPGVLDLGAAGQYGDLQVQGSYPVTAAEWEAGQHDYFCFISRAGGQPLTGSVAVPVAGPKTAP